MLNMLADWWPNYSIEFHYVAIASPFLVASALLGLAGLRRRTRPQWLERLLARTGAVTIVLVVAAAIGTITTGPMPFFGPLSGATASRLDQYTPMPGHAAALGQAADMVPADAIVSVGNNAGGHLSARRRVLVFPAIGDADWVLIDRTRPNLVDRLDPVGFDMALQRLASTGEFSVVFSRDGVMLFRRTGAVGP